jgi:hypothetical protein
MDFEARIAHGKAGALEGGILHWGRERMRDRIAKNAQADGRLYIGGRVRPTL